MINSRGAIPLLATLYSLAISGGAGAAEVRQPSQVAEWSGKDAAWVPTPAVLVDRMLDMAQVTPQDYVIDLGSGDGRCVIAAAKRGARALGVEYDANLVDWSKRVAATQGVADRVEFVQGDMYEADISQASVLALFLLPENLSVLTPKFLNLKPGARIVANSFEIEGWNPDETSRVSGDCGSWCTAHLYIVPAKVTGTWRLPLGLLTLRQKFQMLTGTLWSGGVRAPIKNGRLRGDQIWFTVGGVIYTGRVAGDAMHGTDGAWSAVRLRLSRR